MTVRFGIESPSISLTMMSLLFAAALMFKSTVHAFPFDMLPPVKMASSVATEASFQAVKATVESNSTPHSSRCSTLPCSGQLDLILGGKREHNDKLILPPSQTAMRFPILNLS